MTVGVYDDDSLETETFRSVKEFLTDFKRLKLEEGKDLESPLIGFLDILIRRVKETAMIRQTQETGLVNDVDWGWWSTEGRPSWYIFIQMLEMQLK